MEKFNVEVTFKNLDTGHEVKAKIIGEDERGANVEISLNGLTPK